MGWGRGESGRVENFCFAINTLSAWPSHLTSGDLDSPFSKMALDLVSISQNVCLKTEILRKMEFGGKIS